MAWRYEIIYKHSDMHPDYTGYTIKWGNDKKSVLQTFLKKKPYIKVIEINELSTSEQAAKMED
jgi:hypothetical protein